jgi:hypothetical protein
MTLFVFCCVKLIRFALLYIIVPTYSCKTVQSHVSHSVEVLELTEDLLLGDSSVMLCCIIW